MKLFIMMVGLPASGKTTIRNQIHNALVVSPDDHIGYTKEEPWTFQSSKVAWQKSGESLNQAYKDKVERIVFDATMLTPKRRRKYIEFAKENGYCSIAIYVATPEKVCRQRNAKRDLYRQVPEDTMEDMSSRLVPPIMEEGFDGIMRVDDDICAFAGAEIDEVKELKDVIRKSAEDLRKKNLGGLNG